MFNRDTNPVNLGRHQASTINTCSHAKSKVGENDIKHHGNIIPAKQHVSIAAVSILAY